jgi:hypothetical protein
VDVRAAEHGPDLSQAGERWRQWDQDEKRKSGKRKEEEYFNTEGTEGGHGGPRRRGFGGNANAEARRRETRDRRD